MKQRTEANSCKPPRPVSLSVDVDPMTFGQIFDVFTLFCKGEMVIRKTSITTVRCDKKKKKKKKSGLQKSKEDQNHCTAPRKAIFK